MLEKTTNEIKEILIRIAKENELPLNVEGMDNFIPLYRHFNTFFWTDCETDTDKYILKRRKSLKISKCLKMASFSKHRDKYFCFHCMISDMVYRLGWYSALLRKDIDNRRIRFYGGVSEDSKKLLL